VRLNEGSVDSLHVENSDSRSALASGVLNRTTTYVTGENDPIMTKQSGRLPFCSCLVFSLSLGKTYGSVNVGFVVLFGGCDVAVSELDAAACVTLCPFCSVEAIAATCRWRLLRANYS
jgi:hypothetical protein